MATHPQNVLTFGAYEEDNGKPARAQDTGRESLMTTNALIETNVQPVFSDDEEALETISLTSSLTVRDCSDVAIEQSLTEGSEVPVRDDRGSSGQDSWIEEFSIASSFTLLDGTMSHHADKVNNHKDENGDKLESFSSASSFSLLQGTFNTASTCDWEVLSEATSVSKSNVYEPKSYCDALKSEASTTLVRTQTPSGRKQLRSREKLIPKTIEEEGPTPFDSDFIMDGVKGSRGGKTSLQFKGNQKTQWQPRHGRSQWARNTGRKAHSYKKKYG